MKGKYKIFYLLVLFTLVMQEWKIKPFGSIPTDYHFVTTIIYIFLGFLIFKKSNDSSIFRKFGKKEYLLIIGGIFLSFIPAFIYYNQSPFESFIVSRLQLYWLIIPLLYVIGPSEEEMMTFFYCGICLLVIVLLLKMTNIGMFEIDDFFADRMLSGRDPYTVSGYWMFTIPIFWHLMKIKEKITFKSIFVIAICYVLIYMMENRSTLFPITIMISYIVLFKSKSKLKPFVILFFVIALIIVIDVTQDVWISLFEETTSQVENQDYARNMEIAYFLSENANPGFLTYILGNGQISIHGNPWVEKLFELEIFNSDVGFIGFWNFYGIIPVLVFIYTMIHSIVNKKTPFYLKLWSVQMLTCSLTISYFANPVHMMYYEMFFYLLYLNKAAIANE